MEISNALSEAELRQMKFLARPKVDAFRLEKIREGFKLFEELETNGELSCTYVRELLEGIQRFDLLQKLDLHEPDNAESGKKNCFLSKVYSFVNLVPRVSLSCPPPPPSLALGGVGGGGRHPGNEVAHLFVKP